MRTHIPQSREEFTAEWFTSAIGPKYDGVVSDVSIERIGEGVGFLGELHRCHLTWNRQVGAAPATVVVKVPSRVSKNRALGELMQVYEREIGIYSKLRSDLGIPMLAMCTAPWIRIRCRCWNRSSSCCWRGCLSVVPGDCSIACSTSLPSQSVAPF